MSHIHLLKQQRITPQKEAQTKKDIQKQNLAKQLKTEKLAKKANERYEQVAFSVEQAEAQIEREMVKNGQYPFERKGQGVAAILTHGTYGNQPRWEKLQQIHHVGGCSAVGPKGTPYGAQTLSSAYQSKTSGFQTRGDRSSSPKHLNTQTPVAKYLQQNKRINEHYNKQALQSFSAQKLGSSLDSNFADRNSMLDPPSMFNTVSRFNPRDYEVDLSPDNNCFGKYRPTKVDETYRDRKRVQDSKPKSMIRLQKQEMGLA